MRILLIHGDNLKDSYERLDIVLNNAKAKGYRIENIISNEFNFKEKLSAKSLFREKLVFLLENINLLKSNDYIWIKKNESLSDLFLIIYNEGLLGKTIINKLPKKIKIEEYKLPQPLWKFLDSFYPGNIKKTMHLMNESIKIIEPEFIFTMLSRHLKDLYWVKIDPVGLGYQEWRITKLQSQAEKFNTKLLKSIIFELSEIDLKIKLSKAEVLPSLDFLIIKYLE